MTWFGNRCRRRQDISLLAAGALGDEEKIELQNHLAGCLECRGYLGELQTLTVPLANWAGNLSSIEVTPAMRTRWATEVQEAALTPSVPGPVLRKEKFKFGLGLWRIVWFELIWPSRRAWGGMAALWLVLLAINGRLSDQQMVEPGAHSFSAHDVMQAWEEQNRVLAELTQPALPAAPPVLPRPRSDREQDWEII